MILINTNMDVNYSMFNPSISLCENIKSSKYSFPDPNPNSYYILSEAGKDYQIVENSAILLNFNKGYYVQHFYVNDIKTSILNISNKLFANSKPIEGLAKKALELAILKNGKKVPTLNNRL